MYYPPRNTSRLHPETPQNSRQLDKVHKALEKAIGEHKALPPKEAEAIHKAISTMSPRERNAVLAKLSNSLKSSSRRILVQLKHVFTQDPCKLPIS